MNLKRSALKMTNTSACTESENSGSPDFGSSVSIALLGPAFPMSCTFARRIKARKFVVSSFSESGGRYWSSSPLQGTAIKVLKRLRGSTPSSSSERGLMSWPTMEMAS